MNVKKLFNSAFEKQCPHCDQVIDTRKLNKVPRTEVLKWFDFTPRPHLACPKCQGHVFNTVVNSPFLLVPFGVVLLILILSLYLKSVNIWLVSIPGYQVLFTLIMFGFGWIACRKSKLIAEKI
nr:hypothetical protein [uncultured Deefgea sp.]